MGPSPAGALWCVGAMARRGSVFAGTEMRSLSARAIMGTLGLCPVGPRCTAPLVRSARPGAHKQSPAGNARLPRFAGKTGEARKLLLMEREQGSSQQRPRQYRTRSRCRGRSPSLSIVPARRSGSRSLSSSLARRSPHRRPSTEATRFGPRSSGSDLANPARRRGRWSPDPRSRRTQTASRPCQDRP